MTRSSLTEETPATPGWVDAEVTRLFAPFGEAAAGIRDGYADCLAGVRGAVDTDGGRDRCRATAMRELGDLVADPAAFDQSLQALEAEIARST